ncbi:MAG: hypothetical protein J6X66_15235 [Lachnospiraceae bacterium]|nr:hypothetical protein [Lachnospiraceae bacterium]
MENQHTYYIMDGVLADFERGVKEICGLTPPLQNIYDIINGGNLITCGMIIGIVGVVIKPEWRKSI